MRRTPLFLLPALILLLAGCVSSDADREAAFLDRAEDAALEAGLGWDELEAKGALDFGYALCADWKERTTGDRAIDVSGSQSSVQLSGVADDVMAARVAYVLIASEVLCPV